MYKVCYDNLKLNNKIFYSFLGKVENFCCPAFDISTFTSYEPGPTFSLFSLSSKINFLSAWGSPYSGALGLSLISMGEWSYSPTPGFLLSEEPNLSIFFSI